LISIFLLKAILILHRLFINHAFDIDKFYLLSKITEVFSDSLISY